VSLTYCLMVENWTELGEFLRFADERGCGVFVNTVRQPPRHSLYHLPTDDLRAVVEHLEREGERREEDLGLNAHVWHEQLSRLRAHLRSLDRHEEGGRSDPAPWAAVLEAAAPATPEPEVIARLADRVVDGRIDVLRLDAGERLTEGAAYLGLDVSPLLGAPVTSVLALVAERYGHRADVLAERVEPGSVGRVVSFGEAGRAPTVVVSVTRRGPTPHALTRLAGVLVAPATEGVAVGIGPGPRR
jgi:hypothetical protein